MKKFEITEEQFKELASKLGFTELEKIIPEAFETKLEIGKWYRNIDYNGGEMIAYVSEIHETDVWRFKGYGFCVDGSWSKIGKFGAKKWKLATEEEVKSALIKEAERRGFKGGVNFIPLFKDGSNRESEITFKDNAYLSYDGLENSLDMNFGYSIFCYRIFCKGVWAEIIKTKYLTKKQAEEELKALYNDGYEYEIID